jgi:hypothetical protein
LIQPVEQPIVLRDIAQRLSGATSRKPDELVDIGRQIVALVQQNLELSERAARGDQAAILAIRGLFDRDEDGKLVTNYGGDLAHQAEEALVTSITDDAMRSEALRRQVARLRANLAGDSPTVIERWLAESAALAWLEF